MGTLVLVRHGESEGNAADLFTGSLDAPLTRAGIAEADAAGAAILAAGLRIDCAFSSVLQRATATCRIILACVGRPDIPKLENAALNERDYGTLTGRSKPQAIAIWGAEKVELWRRSFNIGPPGGESLKDTAARVMPYYRVAVLPQLLQGKTVLVVAHGNSLRALLMTLENIEADAVVAQEVRRCAPVVYRFDHKGHVTARAELPL